MQIQKQTLSRGCRRPLQAFNAGGRRISNPSVTAPSSQQLLDSLRDLLGSALTSGSRRLYQRAWRVFIQLSGRFCSSPIPQLPLDPATTALFVSYLSACNLAHSTTTSYLSALGYIHKLRGFPDPTKTFLIRKLLNAQNRKSSADIRLPITQPVLHELVRSLRHTNSSAYHRSHFTAMFMTAFYGFFRVGEIATKGKSLTHSVVQFGLLHFITRDDRVQAAKFTITDFKHDTANRPFDIVNEREESQPFCPVDMLLQYCAARGNKTGPLFCHSDCRAVSFGQFTTELQRCLTFCGLDTNRYKPHGFRIGTASHPAEKGFTDAQISALGRWKYDVFKIYLRSPTLSAN